MSTNLNMVELLRAGLEEAVKKAVTDRLVNEQLKEFEDKIRETIKPIVNSISFSGIKSIRDAMRLRDELHVYLHYDDEIEEKKI